MGLMAPWSYSSFFLDYDQDQVCGRIIHISDILNFYFFIGGQGSREETLLVVHF